MAYAMKRIVMAGIFAVATAYSAVAQQPEKTQYNLPVQEYIQSKNYNVGTDYVHVPPWIRVHRAPFQNFGPNLFGLAYTNTGDTHVREDLTGDEYLEVLQHEVFHQLYPQCSEQQVRMMTVAKFGDKAKIHQRLGWRT